MPRFLTRRLRPLVLILLILSLVIFVLQHVSPGDPARAYVGANASPGDGRRRAGPARAQRPVLPQYFHYLGGLFTGDLGRSLRTRQPVTADLRHLPAGDRRTRARRLRHRPDPGGAVCAVRRAALAGRPRSGAVRCSRWHGAAVPAGARRDHPVSTRANSVAPGQRRRELRRSGTDRHAVRSTPCCTGDRRVRRCAATPGAAGGGPVHRAAVAIGRVLRSLARVDAPRRLRAHCPHRRA